MQFWKVLILQVVAIVGTCLSYRSTITSSPRKLYQNRLNAVSKDPSQKDLKSQPIEVISNIVKPVTEKFDKAKQTVTAVPTITKGIINDVVSIPNTLNNTVRTIAADVNDYVTYVSALPGEISKQVETTTTTIVNFPNEVKSKVENTVYKIASFPAEMSNKVNRFQEDLDSKIKSVRSTYNAIVKFPGKAVKTTVNFVKSGVDTYYDIKESIEAVPKKPRKLNSVRDDAQSKSRSKVKSVSKSPLKEDRVRGKSTKLAKAAKSEFIGSVEEFKEKIYTTIDNLNNVVTGVQNLAVEATTVVEKVKNIPESIEKLAEETTVQVEKVSSDVEKAKIKLSETSEYLWRVVTLVEAKKAIAETEIKINEAQISYRKFKQQLATDPISLITGKPSSPKKKSKESTASTKAGPISQSKGPSDQTASIFNATKNSFQAVYSGLNSAVSAGQKMYKFVSTMAAADSRMVKVNVEIPSKSEASTAQKELTTIPTIEKINLESEVSFRLVDSITQRSD